MAGVYISYPFCSQKCTFCNFASGVFPRQLEQEYGEALRAEAGSFVWPWQPETVYLGGGTPSSMDSGELSRLLRLIPGAPWSEATIEAAPGTITPERAACWRECGLNRVSLGVQSFVARELARTGRKHTAETVEQDLRVLRQAGIERFNIDLIAGLPGQTAASWHESLHWVERLQPGHVSVYLFEVDEDSRLGSEVLLNGKRYGAPDVPGDEQMAEFYEVAVDALAGQGLARYEISNFARPGEESRHNLKYWQLEPYAGFGADAHSFDGEVRSQNAGTPQEYVARWKQGEPFALAMETAVPQEERFFVGLRLTAGIEPRAGEWQQYAAPIRRFLDAGLLETDGRMLWLSPRGVLLSNEVLQEFVTV